KSNTHINNVSSRVNDSRVVVGTEFTRDCSCAFVAGSHRKEMVVWLDWSPAMWIALVRAPALLPIAMAMENI
ncbi:hypothetical protein E2562_006988, partial [Oryza meyeriana var. granulata]